jgi:pimeloyl-ACP methyl ester carboxylesterase
MELAVNARTETLPATLNLPKRHISGGLVALHGAAYGGRSFFLYEHLAGTLPDQGFAMLRFDRRPKVDGTDVPLDVQADDALAAVRLLRQHVPTAPIGLWGWSQGAWAASIAAANHPEDVQFLILVSSCGVSPARQMRFGTAEQLRRRGYSPSDLKKLAQLRLELESYLRGQTDRDRFQKLVQATAEEPWFAHACVSEELPEPGSWADMDFEPRDTFARVRCPVLAFYGDTDEWMPIEDSMAAWELAATESGNADVTLVRLPGCDHAPTPIGRDDLQAISPRYTSTLMDWLARQTGR